MGDFDNPFDIYEEQKQYRTKKINLVLFGGKAGAGKSTAAEYIHRQLIDYSGLRIEHTGFAKAVKEIARSVFGWDEKKDERGRRLLQVIGTEAGRAYDEDMWVKKLEEREASTLFPNHIVLVDDWRFPNERDYFKDNLLYDVTTIRIERPDNAGLSEEGMNHASEISLPSSQKEYLDYNENEDYNFCVFNNHELDFFLGKLDYIVSYLKTKLITY